MAQSSEQWKESSTHMDLSLFLILPTCDETYGDHEHDENDDDESDEDN